MIVKQEVERLMGDLVGIVADASLATTADDRAIERERPLFAALLDASLPQFPSHRVRAGFKMPYAPRPRRKRSAA